MVSKKLPREVPWCTVILVLGTLTFHTITLVGNTQMASALHNIGGSVAGWSLVGIGLSGSFGEELNNDVEGVQTGLTNTIVKIEDVQEGLDNILSLLGIKIQTSVNKSVKHMMEQEGPVDMSGAMGDILSGIMTAIDDIPEARKVNGLLTDFLNEITPSLEIVGKWILKFGPKIQAFVSQMGTTIDRAQKNFDKMMQMFMSSTGEDTMMFETFNLYDMQHTGNINLFDVHEVGSAYAINAYQGETGTKLFEKYAGNNSLIEKGEEFEAFVNDPTVPYGMSILLRSYAKKMAQIGGLVSKAIKRTDMSSAVGQYLTLTVARNLTKVGWVTQMLTNGTLPLPFTACVLITLAELKSDPNRLTTVDTGAVAVGAMVANNMTSVLDAVDLLQNPNFFTTEGFDATIQPMVLSTITEWILIGPKLWQKMIHTVVMLEVGDAKEASEATVPLMKIFEKMPETARRLSQANVKKARRQASAERIAKRARKFHTPAQEELLLQLTGGRAFSDVIAVQSAAEEVVNAGVPCAPVTLLWAKWLAANASSTAKQLQTNSYDYSKTSSSTTDSFNTQIQSITKGINSFVNVMMTYSTPAGIQKLKTMIETFEANMLNEVMAAVRNMILNLVTTELNGLLGLPSKSASLLQETTQANRSSTATKAGSRERAVEILSRVHNASKAAPKESAVDLVFSDVQTTLSELINLLPSGVNTLASAKTEVQQVQSTLDSIFSVLAHKGPGLFAGIGTLYSLIWIMYFFLIAPFTLGIGFYGFWAYGWCGGPKAADDSDYVEPQTFADRMSVCWRCCCSCVTGCCDSSLCFWSFIIFLQIVALLLFVMSIIFTILGGIEVLLAAGCEEIYVINDTSICQTTMTFLLEFLSTFTVGAPTLLNPSTSWCDGHSLLLCSKIKTHLGGSATYTIIGSFLACAFTFQLIFDAATLHEQARWRRMIAEITKNDKEDEADEKES